MGNKEVGGRRQKSVDRLLSSFHPVFVPSVSINTFLLKLSMLCSKSKLQRPVYTPVMYSNTFAFHETIKTKHRAHTPLHSRAAE